LVTPPPEKNKPLFDAALSEPGNHTVSFDTTAVYVPSIGDAKIMTVSYGYHLNDDIQISAVIAIGILNIRISAIRSGDTIFTPFIVHLRFYRFSGPDRNNSCPSARRLCIRQNKAHEALCCACFFPHPTQSAHSR
jgi:hypothetical protein